jgi:hypothetical protein
MTDIERLLAEADAGLAADLKVLGGLSDDEIDALNELVTAPSDENEIEPHDNDGDVPHLTEEEWAYIAEVTGG